MVEANAFSDGRPVTSLYTEGTTAGRIDKVVSERFRKDTAVRRRCILSPLLFNIYMNKSCVFTWNKISLTTSLSFALVVKRENTKIMIIDWAGHITTNSSKTDKYEVVQTYFYVGSSVSSVGVYEEEVKRPSAITRSAVWKLEKIWKDNNQTNQFRLINCLVFFCTEQRPRPSQWKIDWCARNEGACRKSLDCFSHQYKISILEELKENLSYSSIVKSKIRWT